MPTLGRSSSQLEIENDGISRRYLPRVDAYMKCIEAALERRKTYEDREGDGSLDDIFNNDPAIADLNLSKEILPYISRNTIKNTIQETLRFADSNGLDLLKLPEPAWLKEAKGDLNAWKEKGALHRFKAVERDRAGLLAEQWKNTFDRIPAGSHCLDIGCGSGFFVRKMQENHPKLHWRATDLERAMPINGTEDAREKQTWFKQCEIGKPLPYADASMDVITLNNVLHHVDVAGLSRMEQGGDNFSPVEYVNPVAFKQFIQEVKRVLKPGGKLLVTEEFNGERIGDGKQGFPVTIDSLFWRKDPGSQKPIKEWERIVEKFGGFKENEKPRIVGTFGTPGIPVMEVCMTYQKPKAA